MLKKIFLIFALVLIVSLLSCSEEVEEAKESKFNFTLEFGSQFFYFVDTYNGTFGIPERSSAEPITAEFIISEEKMQEIYELFLQYEIYNLPDDVSDYSYNRIRPVNYEAFTYTYKNETRTITCNGVNWHLLTYKYDPDTMPYPMLEASEYTPHTRFQVFSTMIREYIKHREEFEKLRDIVRAS
jgi:hypothetical protein